MSRPIRAAFDVPAGVEEVWRTFTGPGWADTLEAALSDGSHLVSADATDDGGAVVVISRRLPEGIPGFMQKFAPSDGRVTQTDTWRGPEDGERHARWEVAFPGAPGSMGGTTSLVPSGEGCRWSVDGQVKVGIPLIGGRVEGALAPLVERLLARQADVLRAQLTV